MKNIIVAVDFSNATPVVIEMATSLAKAFGAGLQLFHVVEPEPSYTAYGFTPDEFPAMSVFRDEAQRRAKHKLSELLAEVRVEIPAATSHVTEGSPLHSLTDRVIASLLLGSVAEGMIRKATVPVLVVPVAPE